ncbi:MAG: Amuc_1100 family pilus-like protein [Kiritimatiellae bacterium]|nr:Amuc_1100 family pilus-like protein [Kiritimatiellia bacterium]
MKKPQIILVSVGVILGLALLIGIVQAINSVNAASESAKKLEKAQKDYVRIYKTSNPFPNQENKEILEENRDNARDWEQSLLKIIRAGEYKAESKQTNPGYFSNKRQEMIERLTSTAPKGPDGKSVAVEGLTFGFDKYKDGAPASKNNVPRLMMQLSMIDNLVQLLYTAEIDKLKAVRREEFEDVASSDEEETSTSRRSSRRSLRGGRATAATTTNSGGPVEIEPFEQGVVPVDRQRFEFVFDARQDALMKILNAIGTMEPYALVSKLSFTKAGEDYRPPVDEKKEDKKSTRRSRNEEAVEEQTTGIINVRPPSRTSRLVSGVLREAPVTVTMTVDVFTFIADEEEVNSEEDSEETEEAIESESSNDDAESTDGF